MTAMTTPASLYLDLAVAFGALFIIIVLAGLVRSALRRIPEAKRKGRWIFLSRLAFPLIALGTLLSARGIFRVSTDLDTYLEAAIFFFVIVLLIRLSDGAIQA